MALLTRFRPADIGALTGREVDFAEDALYATVAIHGLRAPTGVARVLRADDAEGFFAHFVRFLCLVR